MLAVQQYAQDYDERMPGHSDNTNGIMWTEQIYPYVANAQVYGCPSAAVNSPTTFDQIDSYLNFSWNYYSSSSQNWMKLAQIVRPSEAIVILDNDYYICYPWRNDGSAIDNDGVPRHNEGANIGFVDGHAKWMKPTNYLDRRLWDWDLQ